MTEFISYAQNFEDIYLYRTYSILSSQGEIPSNALNKIIVDIGAWEPVADSVSALFIELHWRALLFEPQPSLTKKLLAYYNSYNNVEIFGTAVGRVAGSVNFFLL